MSVNLPYDPTKIFSVAPLLISNIIADPAQAAELGGLAELATKGTLSRFGCRLNFHTATLLDLKKAFFQCCNSDRPTEDELQAYVGSTIICEVANGYYGPTVSFLSDTAKLRYLNSNRVPPILLSHYKVPEREPAPKEEEPATTTTSSPTTTTPADEDTSTVDSSAQSDDKNKSTDVKGADVTAGTVEIKTSDKDNLEAVDDDTQTAATDATTSSLGLKGGRSSDSGDKKVEFPPPAGSDDAPAVPQSCIVCYDDVVRPVPYAMADFVSCACFVHIYDDEERSRSDHADHVFLFLFFFCLVL